MNAQQQQQIEAALESTLKDASLSSSEEQLIRDAIEALEGERQGLAFVRNRAFKLARGKIEQSPLDVLRWLERIDKIVDNTAAPPQHGSSGEEPACAFSPGEHGLHMIQNAIRGARRSLDICVFTITDDRITAAILDAHRRGIKVRLVTDNDKQFDTGSDIDRIERAGVPTRFDPDPDHMHHKFAIVDGDTLINGSYNWTRGATRNHENVVLQYNRELIDTFSDEFDRLWSAFHIRSK